MERHNGGKAIRMWVTSSLRLLRSAFLSALSEANVQLSSTLYLDAYRRAFPFLPPAPVERPTFIWFSASGLCLKRKIFHLHKALS